MTLTAEGHIRNEVIVVWFSFFDKFTKKRAIDPNAGPAQEKNLHHAFSNIAFLIVKEAQPIEAEWGATAKANSSGDRQPSVRGQHEEAADNRGHARGSGYPECRGEESPPVSSRWTGGIQRSSIRKAAML